MIITKVLSLLSGITELGLRVWDKINKKKVQDRYDKVEANPADEFINTFGMHEPKDRTKNTDTNSSTGECNKTK